MSKPQSGSSVFRPALLIAAGRMVGFVAKFAIPLVLVRVFSQAEFGTYKQLFLIYATLFAVAQLGMSESLYYFIPGAARGGGGYIKNTLVMLALSGIACFALLWWNAARIAAWLNNPALAHYIPWIAAFLLLMLIAVVLETVMISRKQHRLAFWAYALSSIAQAVLVMIPALIFHSLEALLYGLVAFACLRLVATLVYFVRQFPDRPRFEASRWKAHLGYALPFALAVALQIVQGKVHLYAVSSHFDAATFAIYTVGCLDVPFVGLMMTSTVNVMMVRMREYLVAQRNSEVIRLWRDTTRKLMLIFAPFAAVLVVTAHALIVTLYTSRYAASVPIFEIGSAAILLAALFTNGIMRVYAQTRFLVLLQLVKLGVVLLVIGFLMGRLGLIGAITSVAIVNIVGKTLTLWRSKVVMRCTLRQLLPWRALSVTLLITIIAAVPAVAVRLLTHFPSIAELFVIPSVYLSTYAALLWAYGPILPREKRMIMRMTQRFALRLFGRSARQF